MKSGLLSALEHVRADLLDVISALDKGEVEEALSKIDEASARLREKAEELRS